VNHIVVDTGPLVALLDKRDLHHRWTTERLSEITVTLKTCEAVISEAAFLLHNRDPGYRRLHALIQDGIISIDFSYASHWERVNKLLDKYASTPMSFTDACLVRMSEIYANSQIFTTDSDFLYYRRNGRQVIPLIYPGGRR